MRPDASALPCLQAALSELPPSLRPNPIRSAAPAPDRWAGVLGASLVYLGMALSGLGISHFRPASPPPRPPRTDRWDIREFLGKKPPIRELPKVAAQSVGQQTRPRDWVKPEESIRVPLDTPDRLPDGHNQAAGLYHEDMAVGDGALLPPGGGGEAVDVSGGGTPPRILDLGAQPPAILTKQDPLYPRLARAAHLEGTVELSIMIDEGGRPLEILVLSGPTAFLAETERAVRQWRFTPATSNGAACPARFRLTFHFRLQA